MAIENSVLLSNKNRRFFPALHVHEHSLTCEFVPIPNPSNFLTYEEYSICLNVNAQYTKYVILKHYVALQVAEQIFRMHYVKNLMIDKCAKKLNYTVHNLT
jgi:hypothetical protein